MWGRSYLCLPEIESWGLFSVQDYFFSDQRSKEFWWAQKASGPTSILPRTENFKIIYNTTETENYNIEKTVRSNVYYQIFKLVYCVSSTLIGSLNLSYQVIPDDLI